MISPEAIRQFLNRELDDHTWMKKLPEERVDKALASLDPRPELPPEFGIQQKVGFLLGLTFPGFFYIYDMGTGKTNLDLQLKRYRIRTGEIKNWAFVLVPTDEAVLGWEDEIRRWTPELPYTLLQGTSQDKWKQIEAFGEATGVVVSTYIGYASMVSDLQPVRGSKKKKRQPVPEWMHAIAANTDALTLDESTAAGNHDSLTFATVKALSTKSRYRYALAGVPFGRDPLMAWPQFFLVDRGESLSPTLGMFREAFFKKKKNFWGGPYSYDYIMDKNKEPDLARAMSHRSLQYSLDECVTMPELVPSVIRVPFPEENQAYYEKITQELIKARGNFRAVENAFIRMRQIASGFLGFIDDDTGERAQVEFKQNPKLDALMLKLEQTPAGRKSIIWHEYTWTGSRICRALAERGIQHGWLYGGTTDWQNIKDRFNNDPNFGALVVSHKKGAFSLNLQAANYEHIFESPVSPIARAQLQRRAWRQGQTRTVYRYDYVVRGSVEERIMQFIKQGNDIFSALVKNPQKVLEFGLEAQ